MAKDSLFELIQSMSKSEKRYFKLNSSTHSDKENSYVKMFDVINTQKKYIEKNVKEKLKNSIKIKNFAVEKNYLYNFLLKSLTSFHNQKSLNSKASTSLFTIRMLIDKALYIQAKKLIDKNQKFAEQSENYTLLLEILKLKTIFFETSLNNEGINKTYEYIFKVQEIYTNLEKLRFLHHKIYEQVTDIGKMKKTILIDRTKKIMEDPLLENEKLALSNEAKIRYNECWLLYHYLKADFKNAFEVSKRSVEISESTPYYITEKRNNYISNLNNYIIFCNALCKYDESEKINQKIKSLLTKDANSNTNIKIFFSTAIQETNFLLIKSDFEKIYDLIDYYEENLALFKEKAILSIKYGLYINISVLYFVNNDLKSSLKWINKVIHGEEPRTRVDVVGFAWLFNLILHFELGNYDYLEYLSKTTVRLLNKKDMFAETAKILSNHLLKISTSKNNTKEIYQSLYDALESEVCQLERKELEYFDFMHWIKSKINSKTLKETLKGITYTEY